MFSEFLENIIIMILDFIHHNKRSAITWNKEMTKKYIDGKLRCQLKLFSNLALKVKNTTNTKEIIKLQVKIYTI